jgi:CheY-like chemotaxis protein
MRQTPPQPRGACGVTGRKKILLVDDSETSLLMARRLLSGQPYDVITAKDGDEGVRKAVSELPDLILMDVVMPRLNGFDACKLIRDNEATRSIPIIMLTTRGEPQNLEAGFVSGCSDYVTKPINGLELLSKMSSFLGDSA